MFESLSDRLSGIFDKITGRGALSEADVDAALREVRRALLEADVALDVVKSFIDKVRERAVGAERHPLGEARPDGREDRPRPARRDARRGERAGRPQRPRPGRADDGRPAGLRQDDDDGEARQAACPSGRSKKVLMASLDTRRPAAQEQLRVLGEQVGVATLPIVAGQTPVEIARRAHERRHGSAATTSSCSTPPAARMSTSR